MDGLTAAGVGLRLLGALILVGATYNPEGWSYYHWVVPELPAFNAVKAFCGVVLVIGWTVYLRAASRSLGMVGVGLASALFATLIWIAIDYGLIAADSPVAVQYVSILAISGILTIGMVWSRVRRQLTGQVDVDDRDDD